MGNRRGRVSGAATVGEPCKLSKLLIQWRPDVAATPNTGAKGRKKLILNGLPVMGLVRSVKEDTSSTPTRWTVTVIPKQGLAAWSRYSPIVVTGRPFT